MRVSPLLGAALTAAVLLWAGAPLAQQTASPQPKPSAPKPRAPAKPPPPKPAAAKPSAPAVPAPQDYVVKTGYVGADGAATSSTMYANGMHQRVDYGAELAIITPCGGGSTTQIDHKRKRYLTAASRAETPASGTKPGGVVTYTTAVVDTGERKQMLGQEARHVRVTVVKQPGAGACDATAERIETDGWFIDTPPPLACAPARRPSVAVTSDCHDEVAYAGDDAGSAGYPLAYTLTKTPAGGPPSIMTMTVASFERQTLAPGTFAPPAGYTEVGTLPALTSDSPDAVARIGVLPVSVKADAELAADTLASASDALVDALRQTGLRAEALSAADTPAMALAEARSQGFDYVLVSQLTEIRKPSRGLLGRVTGARDFGARIEYLLTAPGGAAPRLSGSARSGSSTLQTAVATAKTVSRFITPLGLLNSQFNFTGALTAAGGAGSATTASSPDPVLNTMFSLLDSFPATRAPLEQPQSEAEAVGAALQREVQALAEALLGK